MINKKKIDEDQKILDYVIIDILKLLISNKIWQTNFLFLGEY